MFAVEGTMIGVGGTRPEPSNELDSFRARKNPVPRSDPAIRSTRQFTTCLGAARKEAGGNGNAGEKSGTLEAVRMSWNVLNIGACETTASARNHPTSGSVQLESIGSEAASPLIRQEYRSSSGTLQSNGPAGWKQ
jgi:hypothetical protein